MNSIFKIRNKKTIVFLISIGISTLMWLLIKLSNDYDVVLDIPINYVNTPSDQTLIETADSTIKIKMIDNGFDILSRKILQSSRSFEIDVSQVQKQQLNEEKTSYTLAKNKLFDKVNKKFGASANILSIIPDELSLVYEKLDSKKVKVVKDFEIQLGPQFQLSSPIEINPDSIILFGAKQQLSLIDSVSTKNMEYLMLETNVQVSIPLLIPAKLKTSAKTIQLSIYVEKYTEASINVPIQIDFEQKDDIKIFPNEVLIKYTVSLDDYNTIEADQFQVVGIKDSLSTGQLQLNIVDFPHNVRIIECSPKIAEFIILN